MSNSVMMELREGYIPVLLTEYRLLVAENADNAATLAIVRRLAAKDKYISDDIKTALGLKDGEQNDE